MGSVFIITAVDPAVDLDREGKGEVQVTVSNTTTRAFHGSAKLVPLGDTLSTWLSVEGKQERHFAPKSTQQFVVKIVVPLGTPGGKYCFRLDMAEMDNPDENFTEGPDVYFGVGVSIAPPPPPKPFPWWTVVVVAGVLLLGTLIIWALLPAEKVQVPDIVGKSILGAKRTLQKAKLKVYEQPQITGIKQPGTVLEQEPVAGTLISEGDTVFLLVEGKVIKTEGLQGPQGPQGPPGNSAVIPCNWEGAKWLSHGWDGSNAWNVGMRITCDSGKVKHFEWITKEGVGQVRN